MISKLYLFSKDTDNPAATGGLQYQVLKTLETWLSNYLLQVDEEIYCDFEEDIFQHNPLTRTVRFRQLKLYSRNFAFQSEEIKKAIAHFFMLHVKTDYQDKDKEFVFEANSRVADYRKGNKANQLLQNWVLNQEALPDELLTACAEQVKSIVEAYVHQRADQLAGRVAADELQEALETFQQLQDTDWFAFTKSIKWRFEDVSSDVEFKRTVAQIETLVTALPFEIPKGQRESLFGLLYKHVSLKSREADPQNRKLTADELTSLLLRAGSEQAQWYEEVYSKWQAQGPPQAFRVGEFFEVLKATKFCRWTKSLQAHDIFWLTVLDAYLADAELALEFRHLVLYERIFLRLRANDYEELPVGTLLGSEAHIREYFADFLVFTEATELKNALNLLFITFTAVTMGKADLRMEEVQRWFKAYKEQLERRLTEVTYPSEVCQLLESSSNLQSFGHAHDKTAERVAKVLEPLEKLLKLLNETSFYQPTQLSFRLGKHIEQLIQLGDAQDEPLIEALSSYVDRLDTFVQRTAAAHQAARREVARGNEYLKSKNASALFKALNHYHKAKDLWLQQETIGNYVLALLSISKVYRALGMHLAAKYYALWVTWYCLHNDDRDLLTHVAEGAGLLFEADYDQGTWMNALAGFEYYIQARHQFDPTPFDAQNDAFAQRIISHYGFILYAAPLLSNELQAVAAAKMAAAGYVGEDFLAPLHQTLHTELPVVKLLDSLAKIMADSPLNDLGPTRTIRFTALSLVWEVTFSNTYQLTAIGEEFCGLLQILLAEFALSKTDFHLTKGNVYIALKLTDKPRPPKPEADNSTYRWRVFVEEVESTQPDTIKLGMAWATTALKSILSEISLLPREEFNTAFWAPFEENGLGNKVMQINSYQRMFRSLFDTKYYEEMHREAFAPVAPLPGLPAPNELMQGKTGLSAKYNEAVAVRRIGERFRNATRNIHLTLAYIKLNPGYPAWLQNLREEGWADWQLVVAMKNFMLDYKAKQAHNRQDFATKEKYFQAVQKTFQEHQNTDEKDWPGLFPLDAFESEGFTLRLHEMSKVVLESFGLEDTSRYPNFTAIRTLLQERFNLQNDSNEADNPLIIEPGFIESRIENALSSAEEIRFFPRDEQSGESAAMVLVVSNPQASRDGYELLLDHYQETPSVLTLKTRGDFIDISLTVSDKNGIVKFNALVFDQEELAAFQQSESEGSRFMLLLGTDEKQQLVINATRDPFTPLVVSAYRHEAG